MKYCPNCGGSGVEGMKFCPQCGQKLTSFDPEEKPTYVPHVGVAVGAGHQKRQRFEPLNVRTKLLLCLLVILLVLDIAAVFSGLAQADLIKRVMRGEAITESEAIANDSRQGAIGFGQTVLYIACFVVLLMWIYRANKNLRSLRPAGLSFTPGWAVGWFFVPFMNLFRPYQVVSEIWKASDPKLGRADDTSWKAAATSPLVGCWWALFLISNSIANIALRTVFGGIGLSDLLNSTYAYMVSDGIDVVYLLVTISMVRGISQFQEASNKLVSLDNARAV